MDPLAVGVDAHRCRHHPVVERETGTVGPVRSRAVDRAFREDQRLAGPHLDGDDARGVQLELQLEVRGIEPRSASQPHRADPLLRAAHELETAVLACRGVERDPHRQLEQLAGVRRHQHRCLEAVLHHVGAGLVPLDRPRARRLAEDL